MASSAPQGICLIVVTVTDQESALVQWGTRFAEAEALKTHVLKAASRADLVAALKTYPVELLVVGNAWTKDAKGKALAERLFREAPCTVIMLDPGEHDATRCRRILVPAVGSSATLALGFSAKLQGQAGAQMVPLYVEAAIGPDARAAGMQELMLILQRSGIEMNENIRPTVSLTDHVLTGIQANSKQADLILLGASSTRPMHRLRQRDLRTGRKAVSSDTAIAVIRQGRPPWKRLFRLSLGGGEPWIPQIEFSDRVDLLQRLKAGSKWNIDYILMLGLSAGIASLGLWMSLPAVIIGGMLVAPLMTPLIGAGLALIQGNVRLVNDAIRAIAFGFLMALLISMLLGFIMPQDVLSPEILARGEPGILDFLVAFLSGIAAAYAMARPSLLGAIAGVAVASALVPPICSVGISLAKNNFEVAEGALTMFFANVVAIILGAAIIFWKMGIRATPVGGNKRAWVHRSLMGLVMVTIILAYPLYRQTLITSEEKEITGKQLTTVPEEIIEVIRKEVAKRPDVVLIGVTRTPLTEDLDMVVYLGSTKHVPEAYADEILKAVASTMDSVPVIAVFMIDKQWSKFLGRPKEPEAETEIDPDL